MITGKLNYVGFAVSTLGYTHKATNICQDASGFFANNKMAIASISDGHGSAIHCRSDIGSKLAVDVGINSVKEFVNTNPSFQGLKKKEIDSKLKQLKENIIYKWNEAILSHLDNNPLNNDELEKIPVNSKEEYLKNKKITRYASIYGATFIISVITNKYYFVLQLGDGDAVLLDSRGFYMPMPVDTKLHFNVTTSLCEENAIDSFRHIYGLTLPTSIILSSDGLKNSYVNVDYLYGLYKDILQDAKVEDTIDLAQGLFNDLPVLSQKGSGDDISLAMIWNKETIQTYMFNGN